jgi:exopolysaccharide biosynthesis polyprenyl glycosylphosphotransferase
VKWLLRLTVAVSVFAAPVATAAYHSARRVGPAGEAPYHDGWLVAYGALFLLSAFVFGVPTVAERFRQALFSAIAASATPLALASIFFVLYVPKIPRFIVVGTPALLAIIFLVTGIINVMVGNARHDRNAAIAVLEPDEAAALAKDLTRPLARSFSLVETLDCNEVALGGEVALRERIAAARANLVILSETAQVHEVIVAQAAHLHESGIRVRSLASFYDEWLGKLPLSELERTGMWFDIRDLHETFYPRLKRLMDVGVALAVMPALLIAIPVVVVVNRFGNRGPLFFGQGRVGHRGREFRILKFRTMLQNEHAAGRGEWTSENDPRITPVGRLLRKTHLDELPQLINVLRGDLSIVGPRPEQVHYVAELSEKIPFYGLRHTVRPGMTGWAQVKYPYGATVEDAIEKLQYDLYYLRHQSLTLDARVCLRTVSSVLFGKGR